MTATGHIEDGESRRLYVLRLGKADVDVAQIMPMEPERGPRYTIWITAFLIRDGERNILVDTGLPLDSIGNPSVFGLPTELMAVDMRAEDYIVQQLERIDLSPADIDVVISTHFHTDHCGGNAAFPNARFFVQREHYEWAVREWGDAPGRGNWDLDGIEYELVDGDQELFPGVEVVLTPGHVQGHQSVIVRLEHGGTFLLTADAANTHVMFEEERTVGMPDPGAGLESIRKLKAIRDATDATVLVSHDSDHRYREIPEYYE